MVDSIATKATTTEGGIARAAATTPVAAAAPATSSTVASPPAVDIAQTGGLARSMAATPPVDTNRVATVKKAIADGRFPILPATIADRLIALKLSWTPNDNAPHDQA